VSEPAAPEPRGDRAGRSLEELRLALAFLTILPVGPRRAVARESVAESLAWFPLCGFMIGALLAVADSSLGFISGWPLKSALTVVLLTLLTGAVHLDGLADTADALGAGRDRERALEIMRDSAIGSFGAIALFFVLALKTIALAGLVGRHRSEALYLAPGLARWAMVAVSCGLDYLRAEGAGSTLLEGDANRSFAFASITALTAVLLAPWRRMLGACAATAIATLALRGFYRRWLGGVTGDAIGAAGEIVEAIVFVVMAA
jgi:adenosylcobinamide-GDP ribazoletransferase